VEPDLVHEPLHCDKVFDGRGFCGVEVDLVFRPEVLFEHPAVFRYLVKDQQRFAARDPGSKGAHALCHFDDLGRDIDRVLVGVHGVGTFPFGRERAVPAAAVAPSRNKEDHLCALMTENTAL